MRILKIIASLVFKLFLVLCVIWVLANHERGASGIHVLLAFVALSLLRALALRSIYDSFLSKGRSESEMDMASIDQLIDGGMPFALYLRSHSIERNRYFEPVHRSPDNDVDMDISRGPNFVPLPFNELENSIIDLLGVHIRTISLNFPNDLSIGKSIRIDSEKDQWYPKFKELVDKTILIFMVGDQASRGVLSEIQWINDNKKCNILLLVSTPSFDRAIDQRFPGILQNISWRISLNSTDSTPLRLRRVDQLPPGMTEYISKLSFSPSS